MCTAVNSAGKSEAVAEIIVDRQTQPIDTIVEEIAIVGSNLDLKCPSKLIDSNIELSVFWKFDNKDELPANSQVVENELRIQSVHPDHNSGRYTCTIFSSGSVIEQISILLKVKGYIDLLIVLNQII